MQMCVSCSDVLIDMSACMHACMCVYMCKQENDGCMDAFCEAREGLKEWGWKE